MRRVLNVILATFSLRIPRNFLGFCPYRAAAVLLADGCRQFVARDDRLGTEDHPRTEDVNRHVMHLRADEGDVVGTTERCSLNRLGLPVDQADGLVCPVYDLVGTEALDREQDRVGDRIDADDAAGHLEVLGRFGQVVVGSVSGAGAAGEECGGGDDDDGLTFHVRSFCRRRMTRSCLSETGQLAPSYETI